MALKDKLGLTAEPLYLIDGSSFFYRAYYAFPDLRRSDGFPTNALFIVLRILTRLLREEKPRYAGFFLDGRGKNFRHELFPAYKANREAMPEPLAAQIEPLKEGAALLGFAPIIPEGVEADDGIASLAARFKARMPVVIVGSDKDLRQCLDANVVLWDPGGKQETLLTLDDFSAEYGLAPSSWPDLQALIGDSSDNIPGIPGIGPKSALAIMHGRPDLERVMAGLDGLKPAWRDKIAAHKDEVFTYRELTRLRLDRLAGMELEDLMVKPGPRREVLDFLTAYEFRSLAREMQTLVAPDPQPAPPQAKSQATQEQFSLLGTPAKAATAPLPAREPKTALVRELPDVSGQEIALIATAEGYELGVGEAEFRISGGTDELIQAVARAGRVFCPSLKDLLGLDQAWSRVPLAAWFDLGLAGYLLAPEDRNYAFERLLAGYEEFLPSIPGRPGGQAALLLGRVLRQKIELAGLTKLMRDLETPLIPVLAGMERAGVVLDLAAFDGFLKEVSANLERVTGEIYALAGGEFNIRSSKQMAEVLHDRLKLKRQGKTPGGAVSTSVEVLERLLGAHPVIEKIVAYRKLEKLRSTYLEPLPRMVGPDGRLRTTFNQLATATGRLSSSNPNLQNIPIRGDMGRRMRACFTAGPGHALAAADYSQIELRVLAHFSLDPTLVEAFTAGVDIHGRTAALLCDKDAAEVTPDERRLAKTINFGLLYGMGPQKLGRDLGISLNAAKDFIAKYFERLGGVKSFYEQVVGQAREQGYVTTMAGRRRFLPEINSRNSQLESQAKRQAVNTVIQGSAADIIKMAMLAAASDQELAGLSATLILQVHDELLVEAPESSARSAGARLAQIMGGIYKLRVPLAVDVGVGINWAMAH